MFIGDDFSTKNGKRGTMVKGAIGAMGLRRGLESKFEKPREAEIQYSQFISFNPPHHLKGTSSSSSGFVSSVSIFSSSDEEMSSASPNKSAPPEAAG